MWRGRMCSGVSIVVGVIFGARTVFWLKNGRCMIILGALPEYWSKAHKTKSRPQKTVAPNYSRRARIAACSENCEKNRPRLRHADLRLEGRQGRG